MFKHYLKIAFRNIQKQKFYSGINILGLAIGIASCLMITLYVLHELSYDRFHEKAARIYRIGTTAHFNGQDLDEAVSAFPLAARLVHDFPEVEAATRIMSTNSYTASYEDKVFSEKKVFCVDSNFFQVFSFQLLKGNPATLLKEPNTLVLTQATARKYFGEADPLGKVIYLSNTGNFKVTGIVQDPPHNSHFYFDMLRSMKDIGENDQWGNIGLYTYIVLKEGTSPEMLASKFPSLVKTYATESGQMGDYDDFLKAGNRWGHSIMALTDIHLHGHSASQLEANSDIKYVYIFSVIALFIFSIACINFMNLATARSASRAKEVGVRKMLGSVKKQLVTQFLFESFLVSGFAMILALGISELLILFFKNISPNTFLSLFEQPWLVPAMLGLILIVGIVVGIYPAFYLTAFRPIEVLKGQMRRGVKSNAVRNILVVFQFAVSIGLIICTAIVYQQLRFMQQKDIGFTKENVILIANTNEKLGKQLEAFKQALQQQPQVVSVSVSDNNQAKNASNYIFRAAETQEGHGFHWFMADHDYAKTIGLQLKEGRWFSTDFPTDAEGIVINEAAVKEIGWKEPIGKMLATYAFGDEKKFNVIGVLKDFNFKSFHEKISPLAIILLKPEYGRNAHIAVRVKAGDMGNRVDVLQQEWKKVEPHTPFEYSFLDQDFDALFQAEQNLSRIFSIFTGLAIFIACLGLFGLAAFTAEQRTKEIGIRKVLGASVNSVMYLLCKNFLKLILIANLIAWPVSWYAMDKWLQDFAYRTEMNFGIFILAGLLAIAIALLTVGFQALKVAYTNPVDSLRTE